MAIRSEKFSDRLLKLAKSRGFNNKKFAEFVGISENSATNYLKNGRVPEADQLVKIAHKLNVSVDWLLQDVYETVIGSEWQHDRVQKNVAVQESVSNHEETETEKLTRQVSEILDSDSDLAKSLTATIQSVHAAIRSQIPQKVITNEHFSGLQRFMDQPRAKALNEKLSELEKINPAAYSEVERIVRELFRDEIPESMKKLNVGEASGSRPDYSKKLDDIIKIVMNSERQITDYLVQTASLREAVLKLENRVDKLTTECRKNQFDGLKTRVKS